MLSMAQVVDIHPESNSVDVVMMKSGQRIANVQVLNTSAGSAFGCTDLAAPDLTDSDKYETTKTDSQDIYCMVAIVDSRPFVLGFVFPQQAQCLFEEKDFRMNRHVSDVYSTIDKDGNMEVFHPSGTFIRIGVDSDHEDLTGKDYDQLWAINKNTDKAVDIRIQVNNQSGQMSEFLLTKLGDLQVTTSADITINGGADIDVSAVGEITFSADMVTINAPLEVNGDSLQHNGTNVGDDHVHGGVDSGSQETGGPE